MFCIADRTAPYANGNMIGAFAVKIGDRFGGIGGVWWGYGGDKVGVLKKNNHPLKSIGYKRLF